ncbi:MAG TPA: amidohydrolase family protein, partial [Bdellovibrionales bacterium]|nr:amidohydrolase family protein [Bdellovibrionales bacterium]
MIGLLALAALCGCATAAKPAAENGDYVRESEVASQEDTSQNEPLKVIDAHLHTDFNGQPEETSKIMQTREQLEREFAEAGVVGAISHAPAEGGPLGDTTGLNVVHCYGVQAKVNVQKLEHALKSRKYRCVKVYLGYEHQFAYDKGYAPVYRLARKYDVPVVFHTGDTYSSKGKLKYADPMTIDEVAVDHPDVTFVIAHCGNPWIQ